MDWFQIGKGVRQGSILSLCLFNLYAEYIMRSTGLEKVSFHFNPKEDQCQRMFKLPNSCTYFTGYQGNAQNSLSQASTVCEP